MAAVAASGGAKSGSVTCVGAGGAVDVAVGCTSVSSNVANTKSAEYVTSLSTQKTNGLDGAHSRRPEGQHRQLDVHNHNKDGNWSDRFSNHSKNDIKQRYMQVVNKNTVSLTCRRIQNALSHLAGQHQGKTKSPAETHRIRHKFERIHRKPIHHAQLYRIGSNATNLV